MALVLPKGHEYAARLIEGVVGFAQSHPGYEFIEVPYEEARTPPAVYRVEADGALVWAHHDNPWVLDLRDRGVKLVSFNSEWLSQGIPCVSFDIQAVPQRAVEHLGTLGRKHAAHVGHLTSGSPAKTQLRENFLAEGRRRGWTVSAFDVPGVPSSEPRRLTNPAAERELIAFLRSLNRPAVIHCDDDYVGVLVCRVAAHIGLSVPDDLAVLGYFDLAIARLSSPSLSSIPAPGQLVGSAGMQVLEALLRGRRKVRRRTKVPPPPVAQRESTGRAIVRDDDIRQAYQMIQEHACDGLTVMELVDRLAISQKTLNKRFLAVYGCTPGQAIRRERVERAKAWLSSAGLSISRIATMCGFRAASNFDFFFKRETGCSPGEYRARQR